MRIKNYFTSSAFVSTTNVSYEIILDMIPCKDDFYCKECGRWKMFSSESFYFQSDRNPTNKTCVECHGQDKSLKAIDNKNKFEKSLVALNKLQKSDFSDEEKWATSNTIDCVDFSKLEEFCGKTLSEKFKIFLRKEKEETHAKVKSILCVSKEALAVQLGISKSYINKLMSEGEIPYEKLGRTVRFRILDIEIWLNKRKRP
ncbi:MAG: helix-turn-helix domain-containing protein [Bacteriovoracaceae bacterium]|nr:helix-turn-helix domain-containing protein [Bacteriovoracaceae bacterium]